jgi:predicted chitinase
MTAWTRLSLATLTAVAMLVTGAAGAHAERWAGTAGADTYVGTAERDVARSYAGNDTIDGRGGDDHLDGGAGRDTIDGGPGDDRIIGGDGNDLVVGGSGKDTIAGGAGNDVIQARDRAVDTIGCGSGTDRVVVDWTDVVAASCEVIERPDVTYDQLVSMFGTLVASRSRVEPGLPRLNAEMRAGRINTPERAAAFLATIVNESWLRHDAVETGVRGTYRGRGYVQLTGSYNYSAAGRYFGQPFRSDPSRVATLTWSAKVARWYWTDFRKINEPADAMDMGRVSRKIGYRWSAREDAKRCEHFKRSMKVLTGSRPKASEVICYRH